MTTPQYYSYWKYIRAVYALPGLWKGMTQDDVRKLIHFRAFGRPVSAKEIDKLGMFNEFLKVCKGLLCPTDVETQMRLQNMPLINLRYRIGQIAAERGQEYVYKIARDKFGTDDLEALDEKQLKDLRNTLCAREVGWQEVPQDRAKPVLAGHDDDNEPF